MTDTENQEPLLFNDEDIPKDWEAEWQGMPSFRMRNRQPEQRITVNFATFDDAVAFGKAIGHPVTRRTDSIWYPKDENYTAPSDFRWHDNES